MTKAIKSNSFCELSHNDMEQLNGGSLLVVAAWAILITFYAAPVAVVAGSVVVDEYQKAAEEAANRGTVDAYTDYHFNNR